MREVQLDDRCSMYDGVKINGREIVDLRYADDISLLSESASGLSSLVESVKDHSEQKGLMLNVKKTKIMDIVGSSNGSDVVVNGESVGKMPAFE